MKQPRYRVTDKRGYVVFADGTKIKAGNLVPKDIQVEEWMVTAGWVKEE